MLKAPHPFPYQGSKRNLMSQIWEVCDLSKVDSVVEPFAGTAAVSLALLANGVVERIHINDKNPHITKLWQAILHSPEELLDGYREVWEGQLDDPRATFLRVREKVNDSYEPHLFLYLLARIVKGAVRYSKSGNFNQSADNRRLGMKPDKMHRNIMAVHSLIQGRAVVTNYCYTDERLYEYDKSNTLIYLDPPYQGVSFTSDSRYVGGVGYEEFCTYLETLLSDFHQIVISYDGSLGDKKYGKDLPESLGYTQFMLNAGLSAQEILAGRRSTTYESLYVSNLLVNKKSLEYRQGSLSLDVA